MAEYYAREYDDGMLNWSFVDVFCCTAGALILIVVIQIFIIQGMVEFEEHQAVLDQLSETEALLEDTKERLAEVESEMEQLFARYEQALDELRGARTELAEVRSRLEAEIAAHEATKEELRREIAAHEDTQRRLQVEKASHIQTQIELAAYQERLDVAIAAKARLEDQLDVIAALRDIPILLGADGRGDVRDLTGKESYNIGDTARVRAVPETGYEFAGWKGNTDVIIEGSPDEPEIEVIMDGRDFSLTARFQEARYKLLLYASPDQYGIVEDKTGEDRYKEGEQAVIEARPYIGFEFVEWTGDVEFVYNPYLYSTVVNVPDRDVEIKAVFRPRAR